MSKPFAEHKPTVAVVLKNIDSQYWQIVKKGLEKGFRDFNLVGEVHAPLNETIEEQSALLMDILNQEPDLLIVSSVSSDIIPILMKFHEINIPVLLLDTDDPWKHKTAYIGTNNVEIGKMAGAFLATQLQPGDEVALISGNINQAVSASRIEGATINLERAAIKVATLKADVKNEKILAKRAMEEILIEYPHIKGVYAVNDIRALGAMEAIMEQGLEIPVIGADGLIEMIELIDEGEIRGTVAQNPYDMGYLSVETARKVLVGETIERTINSGVDFIIKENAKQKINFLENLLR